MLILASPSVVLLYSFFPGIKGHHGLIIQLFIHESGILVLQFNALNNGACALEKLMFGFAGWLVACDSLLCKCVCRRSIHPQLWLWEGIFLLLLNWTALLSESQLLHCLACVATGMQHILFCSLMRHPIGDVNWTLFLNCNLLGTSFKWAFSWDFVAFFSWDVIMYQWSGHIGKEIYMNTSFLKIKWKKGKRKEANLLWHPCNVHYWFEVPEISLQISVWQEMTIIYK